MPTTQLHRGATIATPSAEHTFALAERLGAHAPRSYDECITAEQGSLLICESSSFTDDELIAVGARFRGLGLQLVVATRDGDTLPYELLRNLEALVTEQQLTTC